MTKGLITIARAAEILNVSTETLRKWDKNGHFKAIRDKKNRYRLYSIGAIQQFMKSHQPKRRPTGHLRLTN